MTENKRFDGWKEIADYLNRSIRTTQRLEEDGLPVHRLPGKQSVYAFKDELDTWLAPSIKPEDPIETQIDVKNVEKQLYNRVFSKGMFAIVITFFISLIIILPFLNGYYIRNFFKKNESPHLYYEIRDYKRHSIVDIMDDDNNLYYSLKTHHFPHSEAHNQTFILLKDINSDGLQDITTFDIAADKKTIDFYIQENNHTFKKRDSWDVDFTFEWDDKLYNTFTPLDIEWVDVDTDGEDELAVIQNSSPYSPSMFRIFEKNGQEIVRILHHGLFFNFVVNDFNQDGIPEFYIAGTNNKLCDQCSVPIFMQVRLTLHGDKLLEHSFFDHDLSVKALTPDWLNVIYVNMKKDWVGYKVNIWESAYVPDFLNDNLSIAKFIVGASPTRYTIYDDFRDDGEGFVRGIYFNKHMEVTDANYTEPYLAKVGRTLNDPEIQDLLKPLYWNGKEWQETVCQIPQK